MCACRVYVCVPRHRTCSHTLTLTLKEEQEEIDDDEEQALAQRSNSSAEHGLITISQYR